MMTGALRGLFAVAENYPQLKANENFLKLQKRISELEERIADRREFFNDDVNTYNTRIGQIPEVFVASFMNLKPRAMFQVVRRGPQASRGEVPEQERGRVGAECSDRNISQVKSSEQESPLHTSRTDDQMSPCLPRA